MEQKQEILTKTDFKSWRDLELAAGTAAKWLEFVAKKKRKREKRAKKEQKAEKRKNKQDKHEKQGDNSEIYQNLEVKFDEMKLSKKSTLSIKLNTGDTNIDDFPSRLSNILEKSETSEKMDEISASKNELLFSTQLETFDDDIEKVKVENKSENSEERKKKNKTKKHKKDLELNLSDLDDDLESLKSAKKSKKKHKKQSKFDDLESDDKAKENETENVSNKIPDSCDLLERDVKVSKVKRAVLDLERKLNEPKNAEENRKSSFSPENEIIFPDTAKVKNTKLKENTPENIESYLNIRSNRKNFDENKTAVLKDKKSDKFSKKLELQEESLVRKDSKSNLDLVDKNGGILETLIKSARENDPNGSDSSSLCWTLKNSFYEDKYVYMEVKQPEDLSLEAKRLKEFEDTYLYIEIKPIEEVSYTDENESQSNQRKLESRKSKAEVKTITTKDSETSISNDKTKSFSNDNEDDEDTLVQVSNAENILMSQNPNELSSNSFASRGTDSDAMLSQRIKAKESFSFSKDPSNPKDALKLDMSFDETDNLTAKTKEEDKYNNQRTFFEAKENKSRKLKKSEIDYKQKRRATDVKDQTQTVKAKTVAEENTTDLDFLSIYKQSKGAGSIPVLGEFLPAFDYKFVDGSQFPKELLKVWRSYLVKSRSCPDPEITSCMRGYAPCFVCGKILVSFSNVPPETIEPIGRIHVSNLFFLDPSILHYLFSN